MADICWIRIENGVDPQLGREFRYGDVNAGFWIQFGIWLKFVSTCVSIECYNKAIVDRILIQKIFNYSKNSPI